MDSSEYKDKEGLVCKMNDSSINCLFLIYPFYLFYSE